VKGMLKRGDKQHHIAAFFGVDSRAISTINTAKTFASVSAANILSLPPPGPYRPDPLYSAFYREMVQVNELWNARQLKQAKARLELALRSPAIAEERGRLDESIDHLFRDEFGIMTDFD
jgi:hypothetical protein